MKKALPAKPGIGLGLLCSMLALGAAAQSGDRDRAGISASFEPAGAVRGESAELAIQRTQAGASYPLWRPGGLPRLFLGLQATRTELDPSGGGLAPVPRELYTARTSLRYLHPYSTNLQFFAIAAPGLASDLDAVTGDDILWTVVAMANWTRSPGVTWSGGLMYSQLFGESRVFPALGVVWRASPEWRINLVMPRPSVDYQRASNLVVRLHAGPAGEEWNIRMEGQDRDLALQAYRAGLETQWRFRPHWHVVLDAGYAFSRELELLAAREHVYTATLDDVPYLRAGFAWR